MNNIIIVTALESYNNQGVAGQWTCPAADILTNGIDANPGSLSKRSVMVMTVKCIEAE